MRIVAPRSPPASTATSSNPSASTLWRRCWPMADRADFTRNRLLAVLPPSDVARWTAELEPVDMPLGFVVSESGAHIRHVYFPTTAIVSLLYVMQDGASAEIAVIGNEGI